MRRGGWGGIVRARICFKQGQFYLKRLFIWDPLLESDRRGLNGERIVSIHRYRWEIKEWVGLDRGGRDFFPFPVFNGYT